MVGPRERGRVGGPNKKSAISEYGHVAYHIKWNEAYNDILANILA